MQASAAFAPSGIVALLQGATRANRTGCGWTGQTRPPHELEIIPWPECVHLASPDLSAARIVVTASLCDEHRLRCEDFATTFNQRPRFNCMTKSTSFTRLTMFAEAVIPGILRAHGGSYPKARLRLEIEAGFAEAERGWYDKLDEVDGSGGRRACNAIARALAHLAHAGLIEPTRHCDEVRLKGVLELAHQNTRGASARAH